MSVGSETKSEVKQLQLEVAKIILPYSGWHNAFHNCLIKQAKFSAYM